MTSIGSPSSFFFGGKKAYEIERSLRFNRYDNAYLTRTPSSAGNRKTFTYSAWVKLGQTGINTSTNPGNGLFLSCGAAGTGTNMTLRITNNGYIGIDYYGIGGYYSSGRLRDPSAWYHCVWVMDTTESTAANRMKVYVNGNLFYNNSMGLSQNADTPLNNSSATTIGAYAYSTSHAYRLDAYLTEVHFIDGYAYDPSYFAETNAATGQWNPKEYTGSYGSNGFYLNFSDNSDTTATTLGKDSSGNGNNFTPNNFSTASGISGDSFADTPTNNFCVLNPVLKSQSSQDIRNGNLQRTSNAYKCVGTFVLKNNKYYFEVRVDDSNGNAGIGVTRADTDYRDRDNTEAAAYFTNGEYKIEGGSQTSGWSTFGLNDIIGVAIDTTLSTPKVWFSKNNVWQGTGDPTTAGYSLTAGKEYVFNIDHTSGSSSTTATAFFGAHKGEFNYTPPTGFVAPSSANLPDPTIKLPNQHFNTVLYTGNSSNGHAITGVGFQPDWTWIKARTDTRTHSLIDAVRGAGKIVSSNNTNAEYTDATAFASFDSDGFTVGTSENYINDSSHTYVGWNWNAGDVASKTYKVKVVADSTDYGHGTGSNKYQFFKSDGTTGFGTNGVDLDLEEGGTYIFDWSDSSAQNHPIRFSLTNDGTHSSGTPSGTEYTTGVVKDDSAYKTTITIASGVANLFYYCQNHSGMGAGINTNSTKGSTNFDGTIKSIVKANTTAGFSIVSFTGNATSGATVGHGLGVAPKSLILKERGNANNWIVFHKSLGTQSGNTNVQFLDLTNDIGGGFAAGFNNTDPTSSVFSLGNSNETNRTNGNFITYCFSEVSGYSKFGSYIGNGSSDGPFIFTGFRPAWIMLKRYDSSNNWHIADNKRQNPYNVVTAQIYPNLANPEVAQSDLDIVSNGFKIRNSANFENANGGKYIYFAFAESPFKNARAR